MIPRHTTPRRVSPKREAALRQQHGGRLPASTIAGPKKPMKKKARPAKETARIYGGSEYVRFVKRQPCAACGYAGELSEFAHAKTGGMGRKSDAEHGLPLCAPHAVTMAGIGTALVEGCHRRLHRVGVRTFQREFRVTLAALAAQTRQRWLLECGRRSEALSYGVRCPDCGEWATACTCEDA